jgi:hypothetical protein
VINARLPLPQRFVDLDPGSAEGHAVDGDWRAAMVFEEEPSSFEAVQVELKETP